MLRIDTGQLNQIFPYDTFHCIVQHVSFSPCGFPADVLQESLSSWRICTRTAGKPAPPELDEGTTCTASKHNFSYMVPALLTHFILRHPAVYQKTSRICHTRDDSLSFLIAYSCLWIKPLLLLCQNQFWFMYDMVCHMTSFKDTVTYTSYPDVNLHPSLKLYPNHYESLQLCKHQSMDHCTNAHVHPTDKTPHTPGQTD